MRHTLMRHTLRFRLALLYSGVFFVSGVVLLAIVVASFSASRTSVPVPGQPIVPDATVTQQQGADLRVLLISSSIGLAIMVVAAFIVGWVIAGRALRPLLTMTTTAHAISASSLHSRIGLDSPYAEFKELGATLDDLFGRLEAAFESQRNFVANASHELRTPLTAEKALLQVTLADPDASVATLRSACKELLALGATQEDLIESLLTLASSENGVEQWEGVDLGKITADAVAGRRDEALRRDVQIHSALADARMSGDPRLVESLVANLIDNAIRHNVAGGSVDITTAASDDGAWVEVRNTGPAIPPGEVDRLFVPFQRLSAGRTGQHEGNGLGLAIVKAIANAHGAVVTARAPASGGLEVRALFPVGR